MLARIRKARENESGFTLIELLVVMIIIGILAAIAIPVFLNQRAKARDTATKADVSTVGKEIASYYVDGSTAVFVAVDGTAKKATIYAGADASAPVVTTVNTSDGTVFDSQHAASTDTTWCVAFKNTKGSANNSIWQFSATGGLKPGSCA